MGNYLYSYDSAYLDSYMLSKQLEKAGVDLIHVSGGTTIKRGSSIPAPGTKMGTHSELAAHIKKRVNVPVATVGRITEPWIAEEMIANEMADACMIGRANLCEPEFANKAKEGREHEIRPCIGCLRCLTGIMFGKRVACTINPSFELVNEDTLEAAEVKKNVLVIGGGSVGCELADFLAPTLNDRFPRNRKVTVLEMMPEIMMTEGGVVRSKLAMRMMEKGIRIESGAKVTSVTENTITFERDGIEYVIKDADTLVLANGYHIDSATEDMLKAAGAFYHLIGDGAKVGNIKDAISGAYEVARKL